ncbi:MAG TPA: ribbon-helix-helix protein, CopG family [Streptosporangiaceae bacterium]|jgi:predicted transcriptional regulator
MAMNLRLSDEEAEALRTEAEAQHRSMQDVAREALREYVSRRRADDDVHRLGVEAVERWRTVLDRLAQ